MRDTTKSMDERVEDATWLRKIRANEYTGLGQRDVKRQRRMDSSMARVEEQREREEKEEERKRVANQTVSSETIEDSGEPGPSRRHVREDPSWVPRDPKRKEKPKVITVNLNQKE